MGFSLVELLVVIGIIVLLVGLLAPTLIRARVAARDAACASNVRQVTMALINYANSFRGSFPPNHLAGGVATSWAQASLVGTFIGAHTVFNSHGAITAPVLICPADTEPVLRSYAMNYWASSHRDPAFLTPPLFGTFFRLGAPRHSSKLILVTEGWSYLGGSGTIPPGFAANYVIGTAQVPPGEKFVGFAAGGIPAGRWSLVESELAYVRHRDRASRGAATTAAIGRVHIGYLDGHAALKSDRDLGDRRTLTSTFDSLWSPLDYQLQ